MVLLTLNKLLVTELGSPRRSLGGRAAAVQVVIRTPKMFWVTKNAVVKNLPVTAALPTPRQAEWRLTFARSAPNWRGATGVGTLKQDSRSGKHKAGDTVLKVQAVAQEVLKAAPKPTAGRAATYDATTGRYRTYITYRIHTPEELERLARGTPAR